MTAYRIKEVGEPRPWEGKYGPMVSYDLVLEGEAEKVELAQKPTTPAPSPGQNLEGHIEDGPHGKKFKKEKPAFNGGGGKSPEQQRSIVRQHSQDMALRFLSIYGPEALGPADTSTLEQVVKPLVEWFVKDAGGVEPAQTTPQPAPKPAGEPAQDYPPAPTTAELKAAYEAYMEKAGPKGGLERQEARKKLTLQKVALGIGEDGNVTDTQARQLMAFLVGEV